jgi:hypothetical protein
MIARAPYQPNAEIACQFDQLTLDDAVIASLRCRHLHNELFRHFDAIDYALPMLYHFYISDKAYWPQTVPAHQKYRKLTFR